MRSGARAFVAVAVVVFCGAVSAGGQERSGDPRRLDPRDALLAALGKATLDCLGTVGPSTYTTSDGTLARTFRSCPTGGRQALARVDALLGVQFSAEGRNDDIAGHYVASWDTFTRSFPAHRIAQCPAWTLLNVIDAPTEESIRRIVAQGRIGKESYRYRVQSPECRGDRACAVRHAVACAGGFGDAFLVDRDPARGRVEVDPAWWLTTNEYPDDISNPFKSRGYYHAMSFYGNIPGALYGALERAGERCSKWSEIAGKHFTDRTLQPIDCGGGWQCMCYCN